MASFQLLQRLPEELLQDIFERLDTCAALSLVSKRYYRLATPLVWREVNLRDCRTAHQDGQEGKSDGRKGRSDQRLHVAKM